MPHEDLEITLSEDDPYWSGALYMAVLAYPDDDERTQRDKFHQAIIRWTLQKRIDMDQKWAQELQMIRPAYFSGDDSLHNSILSWGNKLLARRKLVAEHVVLPHLRKFDTGRTHRVEGFRPTVKNMLQLVAWKAKIEGDSTATIADRDWRPFKPVAHAMCAYLVWDNILWAMWGRKKEVDRQLAFLMLPEYVEEVAEIAEHFRSQICNIDQFDVREEQTIRLVTRWI